MSTIFSRIINKDLPGFIIHEDDFNIAFLDISPISYGHTLVVPKKEVDLIFDLNEPSYSNLFLFAKKISFGIKKAVKCKRIGIAVVGLEVPHAHIHLVPLNKISDINFSKQRLKIDNLELEKIRQLIKSKL